MNRFPLDDLVRNVQTKTFRHVEGMFEVLKEIASAEGGPRTSNLESRGSRANLTETYNLLKDDLRSLLMLGVLYHDITKPLKSVGHAMQAAKILEPIDFYSDIKDTDVVRDMGGWHEDVTEAEAKRPCQNFCVSGIGHVICWSILAFASRT
jgi:hypothetical protein